MEVSVLTFFELNVSLECYDAKSGATQSAHFRVEPWILLFNKFNSPLAFGTRREGRSYWMGWSSRTFPDHIIKLLLQLRVLFVCILENRLLVRTLLVNLILPE